MGEVVAGNDGLHKIYCLFVFLLEILTPLRKVFFAKNFQKRLLIFNELQSCKIVFWGFRSRLKFLSPKKAVSGSALSVDLPVPAAARDDLSASICESIDGKPVKKVNRMRFHIGCDFGWRNGYCRPSPVYNRWRLLRRGTVPNDKTSQR